MIDVDPDAWVRVVRARVDAMLEEPQDETAFMELLDIYSLEPLNAEGQKTRSCWVAMFEATD